MDIKRKVAMGAATLAVALGAGHLMQNGFSEVPEHVAAAEIPQSIMPLAAGVVPDLGAATVAEAAPKLPEAAFVPMEPVTQTVETLLVLPEPETALSVAPPACPVTLDVMAGAQATLNLTLIAPCRLSERVMIRHGGLTVTAMTSTTGTLFTSVPGLETAGAVSINFSDGAEVSAADTLPDLNTYRRFAVQWVADDSFQVHAFENGAQFGETGHVSAANPKRRLPNVPMTGGYLSLLGDSTAALPMLAEVYTFPTDTKESVDLSIEVAVTEATCDRELLGEVLLSEAGTVTKTDLTMATPTCDAIGDVLVLNNPLPDLKLAAAN